MEENTMKAEAKHLKLVKWYEAGFPPIDLNANVSGVVAVIAEYKRLVAEVAEKDATIDLPGLTGMEREIDKCVLCGSIDRDLKSDHLREVYKSAQDKLDISQYHPRLMGHEMDALQRGSNPVCSNMRACRNRRKIKSSASKP